MSELTENELRAGINLQVKEIERLRARIAELEAQQRAGVPDARRALAESILRRYPLAWAEYNDRIFSTPRQAQEKCVCGEPESVGVTHRTEGPCYQQEATPSGWYCAHCQRGVDPSEVTYNEAHIECGRIITDDVPPAPQPAEVQHVLYTNADADAPDAIKDRHGDVVLGLCKVCGQAEGDLEKQCPGPKKTPAEVGEIPNFEAVRDKRMSELSPAGQRDARELWIRDQLGWFDEYHAGHIKFLLGRLDEARAQLTAAGGREEWANQAVEAMQRVRFAMEMNNWNWKSEASNDLKREAYQLIVDAIAATHQTAGGVS